MLAVLAVLGVGQAVWAATPLSPVAPPPVPTWSLESDIDLGAFRFAIDIDARDDIAVPTVVEMPVNGAQLKNKQMVAVSDAGDVSAATFNTEVIRASDKRTASSEELSAAHSAMLVDNNTATYAEFPFEEGVQNRVSVILSMEDPVQSSQIQVFFPPNVALPRTVRVTDVSVGGSSPYERVLVSERNMMSGYISFPQTMVDTVNIEFTLNQPLRISEIRVVSNEQPERTEGVRFLMQPDTAYTLYLDPDRTFGNVVYGGVSLQSDEGVLMLKRELLQDNARYIPADSDDDGIPDTLDNCPNTPNEDQRDIDGNRRGDACDDFDRDGVMTTDDNCPQVPNRDQRDTDADGIGDECDSAESRFTEQNPWLPWVGMVIAIGVLGGLLVATVRMRPEDIDVDENTPEGGDEGNNTPQA